MARKKAPRQKKLPLRNQREVWFKKTTIMDLIAPCIECIEGVDSKDDLEIYGLLYGKRLGSRNHRFFVGRVYHIQQAERNPRAGPKAS